jgi:uncharacterized membrane protein (UPF0127 family)
LIDEDTSEVIASEVELADSFWRRLRGLTLRRRFPPGKAMFSSSKSRDVTGCTCLSCGSRSI